MTTYSFSLRLEGLSLDEFDAFAEEFFSPELDATPAVRAGHIHATFHIDALNFRNAVRTAIEHIHRVNSDARIVALESEDGHVIDDAFAA